VIYAHFPGELRLT